MKRESMSTLMQPSLPKVEVEFGIIQVELVLTLV